MNIKTVTTNDGMNTVVFDNSPDVYYWVKNIGTTNITAGATDDTENHAIVKPDNAVRVDTMFNTVYINGAGTVEIYETDKPECPFMVKQKGGDSTIQPLVIFEGTDEGYTLADGFTGFSQYSQGVADININKTVDATTESQYGYRIAKPWSINGAEANYTDSVIVSSNELIDLTNYNTICIDFYGHCDCNISTMSDANDMAAYFKIDKPDSLPQSKVAYDWTGWDNMCMYYRKYGKYYFDVSHLTGKHDLCFGIFHGTYDIGYTNGIKIYKMALI